MLNTYLPYLLSLITVWMTLLAGTRNKWTWVIGLCNQVLWFVWTVSSEQWGFLPLNITLSVVYARNYYLWKKEKNVI